MISKSRAQRRLIIRPGAIGDFVVAIPAMKALREVSLEVWTASQNVPLARFADHACSIVSTGIDSLDPPPSVIARLRQFDSIVSWYGGNRPEFRDWVKRLFLPFEFLQALPPEDAATHAADFCLEQTGNVQLKPGMPRLDCPRSDHGFAVIHPFSGSARKNWPLDRFVELAKRLESRMPVKWCAGPEESLPWPVVRFDDLHNLACWLASARVYVGNDSGISHLAAAAGAPVVALFGATNPAVWGPRGERVHIVDGPSMDEIDVNRVCAASLFAVSCP